MERSVIRGRPRRPSRIPLRAMRATGRTYGRPGSLPVTIAAARPILGKEPHAADEAALADANVRSAAAAFFGFSVEPVR